MVVANSNNCSNCSTHECVNRQRTFFSPRPYLCASPTTNSSKCTGGFVTSWVLTKLTWPSLVEFLYSFCSTLVVLRSFILCFLDCSCYT